ncbi:TPA: Na/Pi cotransporter family protein [Candidatus Poribacteria bacterium]|nr:Na/Pi cotransporter family protein [Candidatus Poribacteria bacterium]HIB91507.1 Na/Pi cotransporter family protein [Candidatus Poribacteria bacterium]HIB98218.1 Na/Pi cotransporter family protein [Candidatus Poribacteria bacterium]HIN32024.1 Na/Pi cotransporter family protein [Candidatus Poribacteria bacterium]HIO47052.1 Na/Pi cotransporter family protein [Candidatus Poribacteria bacterium]
MIKLPIALNRRLIRLVLFCIISIIFSISICLAADSVSSNQANLDLFKMAMGLLGGLALFLFGMEQMSDALKAAAGEQMKNLLAKLAMNRFTGALTGAFVTAIIQSSSVTTVLVVGFITAEVMSLSQAVGIIFGANIGTTITAQIIAFKITKYALLLIAIGFGMLFISKTDRIKNYGGMLMGLGLIFFGMGVMSDGMNPLRTYPPFTDLMERMKNPIFGILASALFTGLVQSSSATTGIVITMASQGLISLPAGIALIFGANIGTCITAALASIGKPREAVRASAVHILFNILGVILWIALIDRLAVLVTLISPAAELGLLASDKLAAETPRQIANAHTIFNVVNTLIFLPFAGYFAKMAEKFIPDLAQVKDEASSQIVLATQYLNPDLLDTAAIAIEQTKLEVLRVANEVRDMLTQIMPAFINNEAQVASNILQADSLTDFLRREIFSYLSKLAGERITAEQSDSTIKLLHVTSELKNIGDVIEKNLVTLLEKKAENNIKFSEEGRAELVEYHHRVLENYDTVIRAFTEDDKILARSALASRSELIELEYAYRRSHYNRLSHNVELSINSSNIHLDLINYLRRINSYNESIVRIILGES